MSFFPTVQVTLDFLECMFRELGIWENINNKYLKSKIVKKDPARDYPNSTSEIIKHFKPSGKHVATTHRIRDNQGSVLHWDAKDLRVADIKLWRV
jgi:hypothetical protein